MKIEHETVARWFNYVRDKSDRWFTESFWDTQLKSKKEIIDNIPQHFHGNYYIFGGWYGVLAHLLDDNVASNEIYTIDIDPKCKEIGDRYFIRPNITYITQDMCDFDYQVNGIGPDDVVINTSTEHLHQHKYDVWWNNIPEGAFYIVQGNDLDIPDHVRSFVSLEHFIEWNRCTNVIFESGMELPGPNNTTYNRYTVMGYKE